MRSRGLLLTAKDATRYAKFPARVFLNSSDRTTVNILDANGAMKTTFSFRPSAGATIQLNGRSTRITSLRPGDELDCQTWQVLPPLEPQ